MADVYLPFHRKYRPRSFKEFVGNEKIKKSGLAALKGDRKPQVLLFQGHAGCGKTTLARLFAKEYLCENRDEENGACGECYNCKMLEEYIETGNSGSLMNVREIDVTDSSRKQDIDEMLEDASIPAYDGSWKIFILDECHMMSNAAQNRLLKNLEEPAEKVLMILCTTDPEKLLPTIISRCQYIFKVTKPTQKELGSLLARVCKQEGVKYDPRGLSLVCVKGDFVPRKSLVALEQVVREKGSVTYEDALEVLNIVADKYFFTFFELLLRDPISIFDYITFIGKIKSEMDLRHFVESLIAFTLRGIYVANGIHVEGLDRSEINQYRVLFSKFTPGDIAYLLDLLLAMKSSQDIEAKLLLLGYRGILRQSSAVTEEKDDLLDATKIKAADEKSVGDKNYLQSITMTEEDKKSFIEERSKPVDLNTLATMFRGTKIDFNNPSSTGEGN